MARCGTEDLDGVSAMVNLQELYLAYNEISDLSPCGMLENLQILDIEGYVSIIIIIFMFALVLPFGTVSPLTFELSV